MDALITGYRIVPDDDGSFKVERDVDPALLQQLSSLLAWQKLVNPITEPLVPECYVEQADVRPPHKLKRPPAILPLFRLFPKPSRPFPGSIPSAREVDRAWIALMAEVETRWNETFPEDKIDIVTRDASGKPRSSIYHAHTPKPKGRVIFRTSDHSCALRRSSSHVPASGWMKDIRMKAEGTANKTRANRRRDGLPQSIGFFVNTNETRGAYEALWDHAGGLIALLRLRQWQERRDVISQDHYPDGYWEQAK
ncbi:UNVERIFIED_ORG: hypothetical protein GGI57_000470 [Rhizobium aethiopicum]